jgi:ligand-binding sensor domain-containing protein
VPCDRLFLSRNRPRVGAGSWLAILLILLAGSFEVSAAPNYFTRVWSTDEGLPQNAVSAIVQTGDGYLWIGTYSGLARFDGVRFVVFNNNNTPEMYSSRVTSLYEDANGNLWIGFETGGLMRYENGRFHTVELSPAWGGRKIISINSDGAGDTWALGIDGALVRVRDGLILQPSNEGISEVGYIVKDRSGSTWVFWNGQASLLEGDRRVPTPFSAETGFVQAICASRDGGLWVADDGRIRKWRDGKWAQDAGPSPWGIRQHAERIYRNAGRRTGGGSRGQGFEPGSARRRQGALLQSHQRPAQRLGANLARRSRRRFVDGHGQGTGRVACGKSCDTKSAGSLAGQGGVVGQRRSDRSIVDRH